MTSTQRKWLMTGLVLTLIILQGCGTGSCGKNSYCAIYEPVYTDTPKTNPEPDANDRNNAAWLEICE